MSENTHKENFWNRLLTYYLDAKESTAERLKMPIVTFYVGLLIITYWEPLLIMLFSSDSIENRAKYINNLYVNKSEIYHYSKLFCVLLTGFLFSIIFPLLTQLINFLIKSAKKSAADEKENLQKRIRLEEERQAIHEYKKSNIKSGQLEKDEYNKTIEDLKFSYEKRIRSLEESMNIQDKNFKESNNQKDKTISTLLNDIDIIKRENRELKKQIEKSHLNKTQLKKIKNILSTEEVLKRIDNIYITILKDTESEEEQKIKKDLITFFAENSYGNITRSLPHKTVFKLNSDGLSFVTSLT